MKVTCLSSLSKDEKLFSDDAVVKNLSQESLNTARTRLELSPLRLLRKGPAKSLEAVPEKQARGV